jgi:PST family polysaccharide transporter
MKQPEKNLRSDLYRNTLLRIPAQIIFFITSIIIARILDPKDFGIVGISMIIIGYIDLLTNFGFTQAIVHKKIRDLNVLNSIFTFNFVISIFLSVLLFVFAENIACFFNADESMHAIQVLSVMFIVTAFHIVPIANLLRDMRFRELVVAELIKRLSSAFFTLTLALTGFGYWSLVLGHLITGVIIAVWLCVKARWLPSIIYIHNRMKTLFDFGLWNLLNAQLTFYADNIDKVLMAKFHGLLLLGFYDKSQSVARFPISSLMMNINAVMFSSFSKDQDEKSRVEKNFLKSLTLVSVIGFPVYTGLMIVAPYFVYGLLGAKWSPMISSFQIILGGCLLRTIYGLSSELNIGIGNYRRNVLRLFVSAVILTAACFFLLKYGLIGISCSFLIYSFVVTLLGLSLAKKGIGISWIHIVRSVLPGFRSSLIMSSVVILLSRVYFVSYTISNLFALSLIGAALYFILVMIEKNDIVKDMKTSVINDIKGVLPFR